MEGENAEMLVETGGQIDTRLMYIPIVKESVRETKSAINGHFERSVYLYICSILSLKIRWHNDAEETAVIIPTHVIVALNFLVSP